jgi:hypothetical protein
VSGRTARPGEAQNGLASRRRESPHSRLSAFGKRRPTTAPIRRSVAPGRAITRVPRVRWRRTIQPARNARCGWPLPASSPRSRRTRARSRRPIASYASASYLSESTGTSTEPAETPTRWLDGLVGFSPMSVHGSLLDCTHHLHVDLKVHQISTARNETASSPTTEVRQARRPIGEGEWRRGRHRTHRSARQRRRTRCLPHGADEQRSPSKLS